MIVQNSVLVGDIPKVLNHTFNYSKNQAKMKNIYFYLTCAFVNITDAMVNGKYLENHTLFIKTIFEIILQ